MKKNYCKDVKISSVIICKKADVHYIFFNTAKRNDN